MQDERRAIMKAISGKTATKGEVGKASLVQEVVALQALLKDLNFS